MRKTYKREVAVVQIFLNWILVMFICWIAITEPDRDMSDLVSLATGLAVWVYGFAGAAFGMDSWAKQIGNDRTPVIEQPPEGYAR